MTHHIEAQLLIKPLAFLLAVLPMVIENLRTGLISNVNNAIIFAAGLGVLVLGPTLGMGAFEIPALSPWMLVVLVPFVMFALKWVRGGAAKFLMALLPWFSPAEYLLVTVTGFMLAGIVGRLRRRPEIQIAPPMALIGLLVQAAALASHR